MMTHNTVAGAVTIGCSYTKNIIVHYKLNCNALVLTNSLRTGNILFPRIDCVPVTIISFRESLCKFAGAHGNVPTKNKLHRVYPQAFISLISRKLCKPKSQNHVCCFPKRIREKASNENHLVCAEVIFLDGRHDGEIACREGRSAGLPSLVTSACMQDTSLHCKIPIDNFYKNSNQKLSMNVSMGRDRKVVAFS